MTLCTLLKIHTTPWVFDARSVRINLAWGETIVVVLQAEPVGQMPKDFRRVVAMSALVASSIKPCNMHQICMSQLIWCRKGNTCMHYLQMYTSTHT